eukprot:7968393-Pyramimonas_sp.AAC.1
MTSFFSRETLLKEINARIPVINAILESVKQLEVEEGEKLTVVDLCSGFGFLSMFLSELLPPEKVSTPMHHNVRAALAIY